MLCFLTVRKLKPGTYESFREAWQPSDEEMQMEEMRRFTQIFQLRRLDDPDEIISFGLYDGDASDLERMRTNERMGEIREEQLERVNRSVESIGADGVYEVVEIIEPAKVAASRQN